MPYDAAGRGGRVGAGVVLIALLASIGYAAWRGGEHRRRRQHVDLISLALIAATLLVAALAVQPVDGGLRIRLPTGKFFAVAAALAALGHRAPSPERGRTRDWLWESWRFVKQSFRRWWSACSWSA